MALKYHRVRRPRRRKNPDAALTTALVSGGVILVAFLVIRHMINRPVPRVALQTPTKAPLNMSKPDVNQLEGDLSGLAGGIFAGGF